MMREIHIQDLQDLDRAAGEFLEAIGDHKLIAFYAPMAAGKRPSQLPCASGSAYVKMR